MDKREERLAEAQLKRRDFLKLLGVGAAVGGLSLTDPLRKAIAASAPKEPFKVALVASSTGPAAGYGLPAHEMMDLMVPLFNSKGGILGRRVELTKYDEGAVTQCVETFKKLTQQEKVDALLGVCSSANALAVAPVAEEAKTIFITPLARSHKITWQNPDDPTKFRKYVFQNTSDTITTAIAAAWAIAKFYPGARVAHVHPDYSYGHEICDIFNAAIKKLDPKAQIVAELFPKMFTPDYSPHISKILGEKPTVVYNVLWGADSTRFFNQCVQRGVTAKTKLMGDHALFFAAEGRSMPKELEGHPMHPLEVLSLAPDPRKRPLNKFYHELYYSKYNKPCSTGGILAANGFLSISAAIEKAAALTGGWPGNEKIAETLKGLVTDTPTGWVGFREDNKSVQGKWTGIHASAKLPHPFTVKEFYYIPAEDIFPPVGIDYAKWIAAW
jgi:branched-chain amino acid transport system substrate-binding protein